MNIDEDIDLENRVVVLTLSALIVQIMFLTVPLALLIRGRRQA